MRDLPRDLPYEEMSCTAVMAEHLVRRVIARREANRAAAGMLERAGCLGEPRRRVRKIRGEDAYKFEYTASRPITDGPARPEIEQQFPLGTAETVRWHEEFYRNGQGC